MVTMAGLQVFVVRFFFQGARKGKLPPPPSHLPAIFRETGELIIGDWRIGYV